MAFPSTPKILHSCCSHGHSLVRLLFYSYENLAFTAEASFAKKLDPPRSQGPLSAPSALFLGEPHFDEARLGCSTEEVPSPQKRLNNRPHRLQTIERLHGQLVEHNLWTARFFLDVLSDEALGQLDVWMDALLEGRPLQIQDPLKRELYDSEMEAYKIETAARRARYKVETVAPAVQGQVSPERVAAYLDERKTLFGLGEAPRFESFALEFYVMPKEQRDHVVAWIQQGFKRIQSFNEGAHSYRLKHVFEQDKENGGFYTSEGQFKGAMSAAGFLPRYPWSKTHIYTISKRSPALKAGQGNSRAFVLQPWDKHRQA